MPSGPTAQAESKPSRSRRLAGFFTRRPVLWTAAALLGGMVIPFGCLAFAAGNGTLVSEWQSGKPDQYANLMLQWPSAGPFYPFLGFCMLCCTLVLLGGQQWINRMWVRFGIYTGIPLAIQFHVFVFCPEEWQVIHLLRPFMALAAITLATTICLVIFVALWALVRKLWSALSKKAFFAGLFCVFVIRSLVIAMNNPSRPLRAAIEPVELQILLMVSLVAATTLATITYTALSFYVWRQAEDRRFRFSIVAMLSGLTWAATFLAAWRQSVLLAIEEYEKLPLSPNCYVCTAAAHGHRQVVGAFDVRVSESTITVNRQLQTLKAFEIAAMKLAPAAHAKLRSVYDCVGPSIASYVRQPLVADIVYLALKPTEWSARFLLWLAQIPREQVQCLYLSDRH